MNHPRLRRRHRLSVEQVKALVTAMENLSILVHGSLEVGVVEEDPSDDTFIACAVEADCIVSGDQHLLSPGSYEGIAIVSAREFLALLRED